MILAGDVGGTKVKLALAKPAGDRVEIVAEQRFESEDYPSLEAVVQAFLSGREAAIDQACFGIAGPVVDGESRMTNLPWMPDRRLLSEALGIERVTLLNDLEAAAYGLDALRPDQFAILHEGDPRGPTAALLAAGTGLGAAIVTWIGGRPHALPTESGHLDFAPRDELEMALLAHLRARYGRVSVERVISGPGLHDLYLFLRDTGREEEPDWLAERLASSEDPSAAISEAALAGEAAICEAALDRFVAAYGAAAGNLALSALALAGVAIGGGIAPEILPALRSGTFAEAFRSKGRMADLLIDVPIKVVLEPRAALLGAARYALIQ